MIKIFLIAIVCGIICLIIKSINNDFFILTLVVSSLIISAVILEYLSQNLSNIIKILNNSSINLDNFKLILKVIGIGYIAEFTSNTLSDFGLETLSKKSIFAGKLIILAYILPILSSLITLIGEFFVE